jgi:nitroreductase
MDAYEALVARVSPLELGEPGPDHAQERAIIAAALRAPDHGRLRPWRFVSIRGDGRQRFGEVLAASLARRDPKAAPELLERERQKALRSPLILVAVARVSASPKIPATEQVLSAGAAAQNIMLASHALGFGALWKTGDAAYDPGVKEALGLEDTDQIVGFLYVGTPKAMPKPVVPLDPDQFLQEWPSF